MADSRFLRLNFVFQITPLYGLYLVGYYKACEPYLTNDMMIAIRNEDVNALAL